MALFAPNRWFPFEGHGARLNDRRSLMRHPVPIVPWLPARVTRRFATARNYWPHELRILVHDAGFTVVDETWALAQFAQYPWMPCSVIKAYRRNLQRLESSPCARFAAVSRLIIAQPR